MKKPLLATALLSLSIVGTAYAQASPDASAPETRETQPFVQRIKTFPVVTVMTSPGVAHPHVHASAYAFFEDRLDNVSALLEKEWDFRDSLDARVSASDARLAMLMSEQRELMHALTHLRARAESKRAHRAHRTHPMRGHIEEPSSSDVSVNEQDQQFNTMRQAAQAFVTSRGAGVPRDSEAEGSTSIVISPSPASALSAQELKAQFHEHQARFKTLVEENRALFEAPGGDSASGMSPLTADELADIRKAHDSLSASVRSLKGHADNRLSGAVTSGLERIGEVIELGGDAILND